MTTAPLRGALAALALSLARLAAAQGEEDAPLRLPEVVVPLPRHEAAGDATASATVVEAARFEGEAKGVAELVATAPGVAVHDYGGLGQLTTVSIRGSSADGVKVLLDGLSLNTAAGGGVDLSSIPRHWIDRIEVVRGAEGARYGSGALGGVVNVITRPAAAGNWSASATGGSFLTGSAAADAATGGDRWALLGAAAVEGSGGGFPYLFSGTPSFPASAREAARENNASLLAGGLVKAWSRVGGGRLDLLAQVSGGRRGLPGLPYAIPPGGSTDWQRDARAALLARHAVSLASGLWLSTELAGRFDRLDLALASLHGDVRQRDLQGGARAEVTWRHGPGTLAAGASAGVERLAEHHAGFGPAVSARGPGKRRHGDPEVSRDGPAQEVALVSAIPEVSAGAAKGDLAGGRVEEDRSRHQSLVDAAALPAWRRPHRLHTHQGVPSLHRPVRGSRVDGRHRVALRTAVCQAGEPVLERRFGQ